MSSALDKRPALIVGATSDIAIALAHRFAKQGRPLHLAARRPEALNDVVADLKIRYKTPIEIHSIDIAQEADFLGKLGAMEPAPRIVVCMVGFMGQQAESEADPSQAQIVIDSNFSGPAALMEAAAKLFAPLDEPTALVGVSSVAGDRGRALNYYYGAAKAGFTAMLSGLRQRLSGSKVSVITVKPGFVATRMTADMQLPPLLTQTDAACAEMIDRAITKRREIVYPLKWRLIMSIIRSIPEPIFKRMSV